MTTTYEFGTNPRTGRPTIPRDRLDALPENCKAVYEDRKMAHVLIPQPNWASEVLLCEIVE